SSVACRTSPPSRPRPRPPRRSSCWRAAACPLRLCRSTTGACDGMIEGPTELAALLVALAPPLEYLAADDFRHAARTTLPLDAVTQGWVAARAASPNATATAALDEIHDLLGRLATASPEARGPLLRRAHALLPALRRLAGEPAAPPEDYTDTRGDLGAALAALG